MFHRIKVTCSESSIIQSFFVGNRTYDAKKQNYTRCLPKHEIYEYFRKRFFSIPTNPRWIYFKYPELSNDSDFCESNYKSRK